MTQNLVQAVVISTLFIAPAGAVFVFALGVRWLWRRVKAQRWNRFREELRVSDRWEDADRKRPVLRVEQADADRPLGWLDAARRRAGERSQAGAVSSGSPRAPGAPTGPASAIREDRHA